MKKNYIFIIIFVLLFAYIGFTSNHEVTSFYSNIVPGVISLSKDYSVTFILLAVVLLGAYIFRKSLAKITGKFRDISNGKVSDTHIGETSSNSDTEETVNDSISMQDSFEDKLKDTYKVD